MKKARLLCMCIIFALTIFSACAQPSAEPSTTATHLNSDIGNATVTDYIYVLDSIASIFSNTQSITDTLALARLIKLVETEPMNQHRYVDAAKALAGLGNKSTAADILRQGLTVMPGNTELQAMLDGLTRLEETTASVSSGLNPAATRAPDSNPTQQPTEKPTQPTATESTPQPSQPQGPVDYITIKGTQYSTSLTTLNLSSTYLSNEDIVPLRNMTNLTTLTLSGNAISDLSPLIRTCEFGRAVVRL